MTRYFQSTVLFLFNKCWPTILIMILCLSKDEKEKISYMVSLECS